eukprot:gene19778-25716_t
MEYHQDCSKSIAFEGYIDLYFSQSSVVPSFSPTSFVSSNAVYIANDLYHNGLEWKAIAISHDGLFFFAVACHNYIYLSTDFGNTWSITYNTKNAWSDIATSKSGKYTVSTTFQGYIYWTRDFGESWNEISISGAWLAVTMSSSGYYIYALQYNGHIYQSKYFENIYLPVYLNSKKWYGLTCSTYGDAVYAIVKGEYIYSSLSYGSYFNISFAEKQQWVALSTTSKGNYAYAVTKGQYIYSTNDFGSTWTVSYSKSNLWSAIVINNVSTVYASDSFGRIYINEGENNWRKIQNTESVITSLATTSSILFSSSLDGYINNYEVAPTANPTNYPTIPVPSNPPTNSPTLLSETQYYSYTGNDQYANVPSFSTYMYVQLWGAGGGSVGSGTASFYNTGSGGGGGYTDAYISLESIRTMIIIVGGGGQSSSAGNSLYSTYGGGGGDYYFGDDRYGLASGGGRTAIQIFDSERSSYVDIVTAGGGGGAGGSGNCTSIDDGGLCLGPCGTGNGGAGGGRIAGNAANYDTIGGTGGNYAIGGSRAPDGGYQDGSQYRGGYGGQFGAGGGGGLYGGGSGGQYDDCIGGGGGGASYVDTNYIVADSHYTINIGSVPDVANTDSLPSYWNGKVGSGASATNLLNDGANGQDGFVVITFY